MRYYTRQPGTRVILAVAFLVFVLAVGTFWFNGNSSSESSTPESTTTTRTKSIDWSKLVVTQDDLGSDWEKGNDPTSGDKASRAELDSTFEQCGATHAPKDPPAQVGDSIQTKLNSDLPLASVSSRVFAVSDTKSASAFIKEMQSSANRECFAKVLNEELSEQAAPVGGSSPTKLSITDVPGFGPGNNAFTLRINLNSEDDLLHTYIDMIVFTHENALCELVFFSMGDPPDLDLEREVLGKVYARAKAA